MNITVTWDDNAQTTLRWEFVDAWTWDELEDALAAAIHQMNSVPYPVTAICDLTRSAPLPMTGSAISHLCHARQLAKDQITAAVLVGASSYMKSIIALYCTIYRQPRDRYLFAASIEEAHALLATRTGAPLQLDIPVHRIYP